MNEQQAGRRLELTRFGGHLKIVQRRFPHVEEDFALRVGVPAADG